MAKLPEHLQAAVNECERQGVEYEYLDRNNKWHFIIRVNGKVGKTILAKTPSDWRTPRNCVKFVKRTIAELR